MALAGERKTAAAQGLSEGISTRAESYFDDLLTVED